MDKLTGSTRYLREAREAVRTLFRWNGTHAEPWHSIPLVWHPRSDGRHHLRNGPHNVLVERADVSPSVMNYNFRRFLRERP